MELTDAQRIIVEQDGNCVVLAAPGSGKTLSSLKRSAGFSLEMNCEIIKV